jgi:hypothetical protein
MSKVDLCSGMIFMDTTFVAFHRMTRGDKCDPRSQVVCLLFH